MVALFSTSVWTRAFTCICSGSKLHSYLVNILTQDVWLRMNGCSFFTCCCVNLCIHLCSVGKLLSYLVNILTQDVWLRMNGCSFLHFCCVNLCIHLCSVCKLLSYLLNIQTQDVWLRMNGFSFPYLLLCELMHSLVLSMYIRLQCTIFSSTYSIHVHNLAMHV